MRTRIKFCGITRAEDVHAAVELGVDALGFVLVAKSKRYLTVERAAELVAITPAFVSSVLLFQDQTAEEIRQALTIIRPNAIQFHGSETPQFCAQFSLPWLKSVAMGSLSADEFKTEIGRYRDAGGLLLDSNKIGELGGKGEVFDWSRVQTFSKEAVLDNKIILAGGLNPENVGEAIKIVRPYAVDVSSGIESSAGIKHTEKMRQFVHAVREMDDAVKRS